MNLSNFNFAQPLWLWTLILIPLAWLWYRFANNLNKKQLNSLEQFADQKLLPHLLISAPQIRRGSNYQGWLYSALLICFAIALANPRWDYKEIDAYAPTASMVVLLDLGASMSAEDVTPSRIVRARQRVEDLLNHSVGMKVGVIGFAAIPHLITPITDDLQTIKAFLPAVDTSLITKQGDSLKLALDSAEDLLDSEPGDKKSILLVSDGNFADIDYSSQLKALHNKKISVYVMGVGTSAGATYRNKKNQIVTSKINEQKLKLIAKQGSGLYIDANYSEATIQKILDRAQQNDATKQIVSGKVRQWEDRYYLFLIPAMMLLLYLISQRAFYSLFLIVCITSFFSTDAQAYEFKDLFSNAAQKGQQEFVSGNFVQAADLFSDPYNKGVALYRAGDFAAAEEQFNKAQRRSIKTAAMYNAGNAQMQQKKWHAAINNYETLLQLEPDHEDAKHNLAIAKKMLADNKQPNDQNKNCDCKDKKQSQDPNKDNSNDVNKDQSKDQNKDSSKEQNKDSNKDSDKDSNKDQKSQNQPPPTPNQPQRPSPLLEDIDAPLSQNDKDKTEQDARAQQWLNRIDGDIKVFLKRKFYVEDMLSSK